MATTAASASSSQSKGKASTKTLGARELQQTLSRLQNELQALAAKIGELESEAEEHELVLSTLNEALQSDPQRKCFRMVGGVLVERTVKDVVPALQTNKEGIKKVVANLLAQYKAKDDELESLKREYNVRPITRG
ncbi:Prefoldin beta-like protein [Sanghuangporus baumii]|uniref:Prefoldin beta-like protein n=1 Tax=Sanghuangporus baumii TaxID=108892 RepID=A0A9Q5I0R4_SANBA|nr:Prefoldin beta-like protein [Sanghuangporus baumii]